MRQLGQLGRFGNQFFQYAFLRSYAERFGRDYEVPAWVGQSLFGHHDPPLRHQLPTFHERRDHGAEDAIIPRLMHPLTNVDVVGFFQYHTSYYAPQRRFIQSLFQPVAAIEQYVRSLRDQLLARSETIIALHLRRGDYGYGHFFVAPTAWYRPWLEACQARWPNATVYLASDDTESVRRELSDFHPVTLRDLAPQPLPFPGYYLDFYMLTQAQAVAISNSTFSFAATMLNDRAQEFMRPCLASRSLIAYDPWNAMPLLRDPKVEDFPGVTEIRSSTREQ